MDKDRRRWEEEEDAPEIVYIYMQKMIQKDEEEATQEEA